jgi:hypothetical protein
LINPKQEKIMREHKQKDNPYEPADNKHLKSLEREAYNDMENRIMWLMDGAAGGYRAAYNDYIESEHSNARVCS